MKFKRGIILVSLLFFGLLVPAYSAEPASAATVNVQNASHYTGGGH